MYTVELLFPVPHSRRARSRVAGGDEPASGAGGDGGGLSAVAAASLRSVQTWAGASLPGAAEPSPEDAPPPPPPPPIREEEDERTVTPSGESSGRAAALKERFKKREKPEKAPTQARKTPQIFRKSGNAPGGDHLEKARRQATLPRSESPGGVAQCEWTHIG